VPREYVCKASSAKLLKTDLIWDLKFPRALAGENGAAGAETKHRCINVDDGDAEATGGDRCYGDIARDGSWEKRLLGLKLQRGPTIASGIEITGLVGPEVWQIADNRRTFRGILLELNFRGGWN
jgi:hypothetical protein